MKNRCKYANTKCIYSGDSDIQPLLSFSWLFFGSIFSFSRFFLSWWSKLIIWIFPRTKEHTLSKSQFHCKIMIIFSNSPFNLFARNCRPLSLFLLMLRVINSIVMSEVCNYCAKRGRCFQIVFYLLQCMYTLMCSHTGTWNGVVINGKQMAIM